MKKFFAEFKEFALRGNMVDLAVGVIIGAAFQAVVKSLVDDVISPAIGIFAKTDFSQLAWAVPGTQVIIGYGAFITALINFIIMAFVVFMLVKILNRIARGHKKQAAPAPTTKTCPYCFTDIPVQATRCPHCTAELADKSK